MKSLLNIKEVKVIVKANQRNKLYPLMGPIWKFDAKFEFHDDRVSFLDRNWKLQVFEKDQNLYLYCDEYIIELNIRSCDGSIFYQIDDEITTDQEEEEEKYTDNKKFLALIMMVESPTYKLTKTTPTYQIPPYLHKASLEIVSKKDGLLNIINIKYQNSNALVEHFKKHTDFAGLFLQKSEGTQCTGNNGAKKIQKNIILYLNSKDNLPESFPEVYSETQSTLK